MPWGVPGKVFRIEDDEMSQKVTDPSGIVSGRLCSVCVRAPQAGAIVFRLRRIDRQCGSRRIGLLIARILHGSTAKYRYM